MKVRLYATIFDGYIETLPRLVTEMSYDHWRSGGDIVANRPVLSWGEVHEETLAAIGHRELWLKLPGAPVEVVATDPDLCSASPACGLADVECSCRAKNCPGAKCWRCGK